MISAIDNAADDSITPVSLSRLTTDSIDTFDIRRPVKSIVSPVSDRMVCVTMSGMRTFDKKLPPKSIALDWSSATIFCVPESASSLTFDNMRPVTSIRSESDVIDVVMTAFTFDKVR